MHKRRVILFIVSLILITGFSLLPRNREWTGTVLSYARDFQKQQNHLDRETRMSKRFGNEYLFSKSIANTFDRKGNKGKVLVLMPPTTYFTKMGIKYHVPEPAVFFYYTGLKTIWANSKDAIQAGWYVRVNQGKIIVDSVADKKSLQDTIIAFQKMGISL
jgi:hypothetical protein